MATKMKYGKGVLTIVFIPLLLNSSDLPSYDSESREMHTKTVAYVSKGGKWVVVFGICSARWQVTLTNDSGKSCFGGNGVEVGGNCDLMKFLQVNGITSSNFFGSAKWVINGES